MAPAKHQMSAQDWSLLAFLALLWGASFTAIQLAVAELPPLTVVFVRVWLASLGLFLFMKIRGIPLPGAGEADGRRKWRGLAVLGLINNVIPFSLIVWSQTQIPSGVASILNATMPLFTVFVAHFFTADEKLTSRRLGGVVIGFFGVASIIGPETLSGFTGTLAGQVAMLGAALSYACGVVIGRRFAVFGMKPVQIAFGQVTMAGILLAPVVFFVDQPLSLPVPSLTAWGALLSLSLASTALAYLIYFRLIAEAGATNASLVTLLVPVVATSLGILFLGESLKASHGVGLMLIALGLMVLDGRLAGLLRRRSA